MSDSESTGADRLDTGWKSEEWVRAFLTGIRGGIPLAEAQIDVMLRLLGASGKVENFLDLGSGDGILSSAILSAHAGSRATLVDFSEPMIRAAGENLSEYSSRTRLVTTDFAGPAWVDSVKDGAPFDAVVSGFAIHHQDDARKKALYAEIFDLLRPGGIFINMEHVSSPTSWVKSVSERQFMENLRAFRERAGVEFSEEELARRKDREANVLAPVDAQCGWLRDTGFVDVDCYFKVFELAVFGGRRPEAEGAGGGGN